MKAILFLCQKSLLMRKKKATKEEQAEEDRNCEKGAIYDEEEEAEFIDLDSEEDSAFEFDDEEDFNQGLYDSVQDQIDEIIYVNDSLQKLQQADGQHFSHIMSFLTPEEQQGLQQFI